MFWHKFSYGPLIGTKYRIPSVDIEVCSPNQPNSNVPVSAILDTGADRTCVPERVFIDLGLNNFEYRERPVQGAFGDVVSKTLYIVNIKLAKCVTYDIEVIGLDENFALIGRDILNLHEVNLDGPNGVWYIDKKCPQLS